MTEPESIGVARAKREFADVLGAVRHGGKRFVIHRRGTHMAALVPVEDLQRTAGGGGFLSLVGRFDDAEELPEVLDEIVRTRSAQRKGRPPRSTA